MSDVVRYDTVTRAIKTVLQRAGDKGATFEQLTDYAWAHRSGYIKPAEDPTDLGPRVAKDLLCLHQDGEVTLCFFPQVTPKPARWFNTLLLSIPDESGDEPLRLVIPPAVYRDNPENKDQRPIDWLATLRNLFTQHPHQRFTNPQIFAIYYTHLCYHKQARQEHAQAIGSYFGQLSRAGLIQRVDDAWQSTQAVVTVPAVTKPSVAGFTLYLEIPFEYPDLVSARLHHQPQDWDITFHARPGYNLEIYSHLKPPEMLQGVEELPPIDKFTGVITLTTTSGDTKEIVIGAPLRLYIYFVPA